MKKIFFTLPVFICLFSLHGNTQFTHENLKIKNTAGSPESGGSKPEQFDVSFQFKNLRLYPVIANAAFVNFNKDLGKFTMLREAIEQNKIIIRETGANLDGNNVNPVIPNRNPNNNRQIQQSNISNGDVGGTVNTLIAKNISSDTIFIMAGEVVKGGKQDRVIGQDVVIAPGEEINLSAFCVENNRWSTKDGNNGQFNGYFNVSSMDIRKIVTEEKNQSEVWNKVDEHTGKNGASSDTKTYTNLENSPEYQAQLKAYLDKFLKAFQGDTTVVGVIAVTGDKIIGCDLFATHQLFIDSYNNLIYSYVGYAITNGSEVKITNEQVYAYLDQILRSEEGQKEAVEENGTVYEYKKKKIHMTKY